MDLRLQPPQGFPDVLKRPLKRLGTQDGCPEIGLAQDLGVAGQEVGDVIIPPGVDLDALRDALLDPLPVSLAKYLVGPDDKMIEIGQMFRLISEGLLDDVLTALVERGFVVVPELALPAPLLPLLAELTVLGQCEVKLDHRLHADCDEPPEAPVVALDEAVAQKFPVSPRRAR